MMMSDCRTIELSGNWMAAAFEAAVSTDHVPDMTGLEWIEAQVPGVVHYDLMRAGKLRNPFESSEAAFAAEWVAKTDWIYRTSFDVDAGMLQAAKLELRFECVDTYADIWLNGERIGSTANMYRSYAFDVSGAGLKAAGNELIVHIKNHYRMAEPMKQEAAARMNRTDAANGLFGKSVIRRYQRSFFTNSSLLNLGTGVLGIGICRAVRLAALPEAYVRDVHLAIDALTDERADLRVQVDLERTQGSASELKVEAILWEPDRSQQAAAQSSAVRSGEAELALTVERPKRWWPRGYGEQHLYRLTVNVYDGGRLLHSITKRVGLKTAAVVTEFENGRKTFYLTVNGQKVHARGSNLIPLDYLKGYDSWDACERMLRLVESGNQNMIRMWGGGLLETEAFYDRCDEAGIMIWQDFFLHSNVYPDYDETFVEEFRREAVEMAKRVRGHACLVLICGGNEQQEGWDEWNWKAEMDRFYGEKLVRELLPEVARQYMPEIPYVYNSPHGGAMSQSPVEGDAHVWGNFFNATKDPQFVTETCWNLESYSRPETLKASMGLDAEAFQGTGWPKKWRQITGLPLLTRFPFTSYQNPETLRSYLKSLEIEQAQADYHALSMFRLRSSSCSGMLYWSLNKGGPLFGFGCVDYKGYPMMSYYAVKRVYEDVRVGAYRDIDDIRFVVSNLTTRPVSGELQVRHLDHLGTELNRWTEPLTVAAGETVRAFELPEYYRRIIDRTREIVYVEYVADGETISADALFFCPLREFAVAPGAVDASAIRTDTGWTLEIETATVAKMIELEGNKKWLFSDNYFVLVPGTKRRLTVELLEDTNDEAPIITVGSLDLPERRTLNLQ